MHRRRLILAPKATDKDLIVSIQEDNQDFPTHNNSIGNGSSPDISSISTHSFLKNSNANASSVQTGEHFPAAATVALDAQPHGPNQKENQSTLFHFLRGNQRNVKLKHTLSTRRRPTQQFYDFVSTVFLVFMAYILLETLKMTINLGSVSLSGDKGEGLQQPEKDSLLPLKDDNNHQHAEPSFRILFDPSWMEDRPSGIGHRRHRPFLLLRPMVIKTMQEYEEHETPNYGMLGFYSLEAASLFYRNINLREDEKLYEAYRSKVVRVWDSWPPAKTKLGRQYEPTEDLQDSFVGSRQRKVLPLSRGSDGNRNWTGTDDASKTSNRDNQEEDDDEEEDENNSEPTRSCHRARWQERSYPTCNTLHELVTHRPLPDMGGVSGISTSIRNHPMGNVVAGVQETAHTRTQCLQPYNVSNLRYVCETKTL
jgi:hypothetical protein